MTRSAVMTIEGPCAELRLCQEPCNEIGSEMLLALEDALDRLGNSDARALVIHSDRRGFSAGAHLRELHSAIVDRAPDDYGPDLRSFIERVHAVMDRLDMLPLTTIGAIHGPCLGGGFELALTCDVLVADRTARFCLPELRLGIIPAFGGIPRLRRELPNGVIRDLLLTGRSLGAKRAWELGLVSQLVARGQALSAARACARQAALFVPSVRREAKRFIKPLPVEELARERAMFLRMSRDVHFKAALAEFVARSDPMPYQPLAVPMGGRDGARRGEEEAT
ncbi:MAG: enoyl-CoA hydratase/isomerase family protein [Myxococcales bacterium]|nr:enoyl-CoA hydratase/isomerase family protein [Myxococcales bacterium]MDD9972151.1 enoyl-CoA hydratase/isomerase family protein [Myxococcales bacterium]